MRRAIVLLALFSVAASEGDCAGHMPAGPYEPCARKVCGEACRACPPAVLSCVETADAKACDPFGQCVPVTDGLCAAAAAPCATKRCGEACVVDPPCRSAIPPCTVASQSGLCDKNGICETSPPVGPGFCAPPLPDWGCRGKACGDACDYCPLEADPTTCPLPTGAATACDAGLQCITAGTFTCGP